MKRINTLIWTAAIVASILSCTKETKAPTEPEEGCVKLTAEIESAAKTVLAEGNTVEWLADDAISIFDGTENKKLTVSGAGATTTFSFDPETAGPWYAIYPYSGAATIENGVISATVPAIQTAVPGTFANGLNISVALSDAGHLSFKNVLAYVKVTVSKTLIRKIVLSGKNGENIAGSIKISYNSGAPTYVVEDGVTSIELAPESGYFQKDATYYIAVLPQTLENGFTLSYIDAFNDEHVVPGNNPAALLRKKILNLNSPDASIQIDGPITFADPDVKADLLKAGIGGEIEDGEIYKSEAAAVTYEKLSVFDPALPGSSTANPNKVCDASSLWTDPTAVDSFDELKYFIGLARTETDNRLPVLFPKCTNLVSVTFPYNLTTIANYCFQGCSKLNNVKLPENLTAVYTYCFADCTGMTGKLEIPGTVKSLSACAFMRCSADTILFPRNAALKTVGDYAFYQCSKMKRFEAYDNVIESLGKYAFSGCNNMVLSTRNYTSLATIGQYAFENCYKIKNLTITSSNLTTIERNAFYQCKALVNVYLSSSVTEIAMFAFSGCFSMTGLSYVKSGDTGLKLPEGLTTIGKCAFGGCKSIKDVIFPSTVTTIGDNVFRTEKLTTGGVAEEHIVNLDSWTVYATSVPSLGANPFLKKDTAGSVASILVPNESVNAYKAATNWSSLAAVISGF